MAIPAYNYAALPTPQYNIYSGNQFADALRALQGGINAGVDLSGKLEKQKGDQLANALSKIKLQNAPQEAQADLQAKLLANALSQNSVDYAPQMSQADLAYKNASTNHVNAETDLMPLDYALKANQQNNNSNRFGAAYQQAKMISQMPAAARDKWIADNSQAYLDMVNTLGNQDLQKETSKSQQLVDRLIEQHFPSQKKNEPQPPQNLPLNQQQIAALVAQLQPQNGAAGQPGQQMPQQAPGMQRTPFSTSPEQAASIGNASLMSANKALTTAATQRQIEASIQVGDILNNPELQQKAQNAAIYAGAAGKGEAAIDALLDTNPQAYNDYISFVNHDMVFTENRIKTMDQMGATDAQREELQGLYNKTMDTLTSNPGRFIAQYNELGQALDRVAKAVQKSASPVAPVERLTPFNPIGSASGQASPGKARHYNMATGELE